MTLDVRLRPITESDLAVLFENQHDPESSAMAGVPARELDAFLAHRAKIEADPDAVTRAIVIDGDQVAGDIVSWKAESGVREIGYRIGRSYWGRGVATAALTAFLTEVTERPLYASVVKNNAGSMRVLEKCGFTRLREGEAPGEPDPEAYDLILE
jgi:RimJ/RimL family protein N-acetyltransferase